jgi:ADP-heptose:LPS heptosyltransferase
LNILLVRLRLIGDVVFTTPIISALSRAYPTARLSYLVEQSAAPVVASNPHLASVITTTHSRGWRRIKDDVALARRLRRERFDIAVDLHGGPRSGWLTWASGARVRVGYDVPGRSWMYTRVVARPKSYRPRHAVENQWDLLAAVDPVFPRKPSRTDDPVAMWSRADDAHSVARHLRAWSIPEDASLIVLHVSAGNPFRRWPEAAFATLAAALARKTPGRYVLVTAGPSDREAALRVIDDARRQSPRDAAARIVAADTLSLGELRAVLDRSALFIGGDSGPLHIASTSRAPIVSIFGPTLPERSAPWRADTIPTRAVEPGPLTCRPCDQRVCAPGDFRCLSGIAATDVERAAEELLGATR